jgi:four helix bundle protein
MKTDRDVMQARMKSFALRVIRLCQRLPNNHVGWVLGKQLVKSGTAIGANYAEALRSSSQAHFVSIIEIAQREAAETKYWLELVAESRLVQPTLLVNLDDECEQLLRILTSTARSAKQHLNQKT